MRQIPKDSAEVFVKCWSFLSSRDFIFMHILDVLRACESFLIEERLQPDTAVLAFKHVFGNVFNISTDFMGTEAFMSISVFSDRNQTWYNNINFKHSIPVRIFREMPNGMADLVTIFCFFSIWLSEIF